MEKEIRVVLVTTEPHNGNRIRTEIMPNTLEAFHNAVGGYIEAFHPVGYGLDWICNEEGKIHNLRPNFAVMFGDRVADIIVGDVVICRHDEEGNFSSLSTQDITKIKAYFQQADIVRLVAPEP